MQKTPDAFTEMMAAWNERDLAQIRAHIDKSLAESVVFADPTNFICGRAAFEEMIKDFRRKYPEAVCARTSGLDSHNNRYRYTWQISVGQTVFIKGTDFVRLNENGLVESVDGFFGDLPRLES
jgi:hypothetical protein